MPESIRSKRLLQSGRVLTSARLVSCLALPVLLSALPGCSGDPDASQVGSASSGNSVASSPG
ncbi:MAG TPA: hypothetical protein VFK05_22435, partial [Polyangiaceae bacterium]|nr:hypothetical protein [Polyangiaceae bacterium]